MFVTVSVHFPLLLRTSGSSRNDPTQTSPKLPLSAKTTLSRGGGAKPDTDSVCGLLASLLNTLIVAACAPRLEGSKRRTTSSDSPGLMTRGYEVTPGAWNSVDDETMLLMDNWQEPVLLSVSCPSRNAPRHTLPNAPWSAMAVASFATPRTPVANRSTTGAFGSLLMIRIVAASGTVAAVGEYATVNSMSSPGGRISGVAGLESTLKPEDPMSRCTLVTTRSLLPTL